VQATWVHGLLARLGGLLGTSPANPGT